MYEIGQNFPKSREARKEKLKEIKKQGHSISKMKVPAHGTVDVYRIPLDCLSYNPYNTRFLAQAKTLETRLGRNLSDERPEDIIEIEKFIWNYKQDKNDNTIQSLIKEGQLQPGVVTPSGLILSGNRRFRLINEIQRNYQKYSQPGVNLDGLKYFEAAILDDELSEKDIRKYESFYQYGNEDKVDYDPIQKYIAANEQLRLNYTKKEVADNFLTLTNGDPKKVDEWIAIFELMEEYLDYFGEHGIYTALETREEAFINLYKTLKSLRQGKAGRDLWAYEEYDIEDLKIRYFDYIRLNKATHDFRDFKKIFSDPERWKIFNHRVKVNTETIDIEPLERYRSEHPDETESQISQKRENDYKNAVEKALNSALGDEKAIITSKETDETPFTIIEQIKSRISKLEKVIDDRNYSEVIESEEFYNEIKNLNSQMGKLKQRID